MNRPPSLAQKPQHLRLVHRKRANLSHAAIAFLKVVRSLSLERGAPYEFRVERAG